MGNQYKLYRMTPLSYHGYSVSGSSSQQCGGIPLKTAFLLAVHKHNHCVIIDCHTPLIFQLVEDKTLIYLIRPKKKKRSVSRTRAHKYVAAI